MLIFVDDLSKQVKIYLSQNTTPSENREYYSELKKYREQDYSVSVFLDKN